MRLKIYSFEGVYVSTAVDHHRSMVETYYLTRTIFGTHVPSRSPPQVASHMIPVEQADRALHLEESYVYPHTQRSAIS